VPDDLRDALVTALQGAPSGPQTPDYGYGFRYNSQDPKGLGFLGPLKPADGHDVMGEYSVGVPLNGQETEVPSIVPTLTKAEVQELLQSNGKPPSPEIQQKAMAYARFRRNAGLPVFALTGEQQNSYPDLPRVETPPAQTQAPPLAVSHARGK
jgi:hypothetical protein